MVSVSSSSKNQEDTNDGAATAIAAAIRLDENSDERVMNDTTMPPPSVKRIPQQQSSSTLSAAPVKAAAIIPKQRKKVGRFGLSDWTRLLSVSNDLAQRKGQPVRSKISWKEIKKHNTVYDGWMVIKGKVYNITPYLPYHPGGEKILKGCLGRDGTALYEKYHQWVNEDGLIGKLLLGYLDKNSKYDSDDDSDSDDDGPSTYQIPSSVIPSSLTSSKLAKSDDGFKLPLPPPKK